MPVGEKEQTLDSLFHVDNSTSELAYQHQHHQHVGRAHFSRHCNQRGRKHHQRHYDLPRLSIIPTTTRNRLVCAHSDLGLGRSRQRQEQEAAKRTENSTAMCAEMEGIPFRHGLGSHCHLPWHTVMFSQPHVRSVRPRKHAHLSTCDVEWVCVCVCVCARIVF